ncbi:MAG: hypothetical protein VKL97_01175 [Cyanobacteriota bacterium]|nr:hypothetical protein [Cyanobacteriota bacterium]
MPISSRRSRLLVLLLALVALTPGPVVARVRGGEAVEVCVLVPRVEPLDEGDAFGDVPTATPALVVVEPLHQVRIEEPSGQLLWQRSAAGVDPLPMPLAWPLPPLQPDEEILLRLQPVGAAADAYAHVRLRASGAARLKATAELIASLASDQQAWLAALRTALTAGDVPLAWSLLYAPQAPATGPLLELRQELVRRGCGG